MCLMLVWTSQNNSTSGAEVLFSVCFFLPLPVPSFAELLMSLPVSFSGSRLSCSSATHRFLQICWLNMISALWCIACAHLLCVSCANCICCFLSRCCSEGWRMYLMKLSWLPLSHQRRRERGNAVYFEMLDLFSHKPLSHSLNVLLFKLKLCP